MRTTLIVHIAAGALAILAGYMALSVTKGARLHRRSGTLFVYSMVILGGTGAVVAALTGVEASVFAGTLAVYLVVTALTTVRPPAAGPHWLDLGAMLVALVLGVASLTIGAGMLAGGEMTRDTIPVFIFFLFGSVALLAGLSDLRVMRSGRLQGTRRLARHLWRMCFALYLASASFFLGQADEIPEPIRIPALLAIPAFLPLVAMVYWLVRVRLRRPYPGILEIGSS